MARIATLLVMVASMGAPAIAADRLTDKDVKALVARIEEGRDRFDDALDGDLKRSILRGPSGEVNVDQFLNDFQESIDRLEERLKPDYAASAEAATLLRQASIIDAYFKRQPAGTKGESEWNRMAADLKALAAAYGAEFPLADSTTVRRMGDRELATALDAMARSAALLKKSLDADLKRDSTVSTPTREGIVREADQLSKDAKALRDRVKDSQASSAEADRLLARAAKLESLIGSHEIPTSASAWSDVKNRRMQVAAAYGISR